MWRLTHMQAADTECSDMVQSDDDIQSDVMMQSDHDHTKIITLL